MSDGGALECPGKPRKSISAALPIPSVTDRDGLGLLTFLVGFCTIGNWNDLKPIFGMSSDRNAPRGDRRSYFQAKKWCFSRFGKA